MSAKVGWDFTRNAAGQILTDAHDNNVYAWTGRVNVGATYTTNGLNQYTQYAGNDATGFCYDPNGNLTADKNSAYLYDAENRLVEMHVRESPSACPAGASGYGGQLQARLHYDPNGRLAETCKPFSYTLPVCHAFWRFFVTVYRQAHRTPSVWTRRPGSARRQPFDFAAPGVFLH